MAILTLPVLLAAPAQADETLTYDPNDNRLTDGNTTQTPGPEERFAGICCWQLLRQEA